MKRVKTEFLSSKLVRFSQQILNANISALGRDNQSSYSHLFNKNSDLVYFGPIFGPNFGDFVLFLGPKLPFFGPIFLNCLMAGMNVSSLHCIETSVRCEVQLCLILTPLVCDNKHSENHNYRVTQSDYLIYFRWNKWLISSSRFMV